MRLFRLLSLCSCALLFSCSNDDIFEIEKIDLSANETEIVDSQQKFYYNFFNEICKEADKTGDNIIISPLGAEMEMAMYANGAAGSTLNSMLTTLGCSNDIETLNKLNYKLIKNLPRLDRDVDIKIANSTWINHGFEVNKSFLTTLSKSYNTSSNMVDMFGEEAVEKINNWCSENSNGIIKNAIATPPSKNFSIINSIYFKGKWFEKFDINLTKKSTFHGNNGDTEVEMMNKSLSANSLINDGFSAVSINYGDKKYRMVILMKTDDDADILNWLSNDNLSKFKENSHINLSLPRFDIKTKSNIIDALTESGFKQAFDSNADFSGISNSFSGIKSLVQISRLIVNEDGTEAASITINGDTSVIPDYSNFIVDRPFYFIIDEAETGVIMFMGKINNL